MPRPKTKDELLEATRVSYDKLVRLWDAIPPEQTCALFPEQLLAKGSEAHWRRDKCLRDVVIHLHEWHNLVTTFVSTNYAGTPQAFFPESYTWRNYAKLNEDFTARYQYTALREARDLLDISHHQILDLIESFTNEELFTKKYFTWTGTTSLGSYFVSSTSSHYEWAAKKTRAWMRLSPANPLSTPAGRTSVDNTQITRT